MSQHMMKAVVFDHHGGTEVLGLREIPVPTPGPNDALVRIKAAGFNFNDVWGRRGLPGMDFHLPHISGSDASGVVVAVGSEVRTVKPGDEVIANGAFACHQCPACLRGDLFVCRDFRIWGFQTGPLQGAQAQYGVVPAAELLPKPPNLSFAEAASLPLCLVTAWRMLVVRARIQPGDFVLIWGGAGGLGTMAIQICNLFGARAIAVVASEEKAEHCRKLGAEFVLNRKTQRLIREIQRITDKRGVDVVFEHVGQSTWETSSMALRWGGTIVICGATSGFTGTIDFRFLWNKQQNYLGSHYGTTAELEQAMRFVASGKIRPVLHTTLPLAEVAKAHELLEADAVMGKVVLVPPEDGA
jgi:NADPH:quinone reductase-like Zn-dependent oxidoreductase